MRHWLEKKLNLKQPLPDSLGTWEVLEYVMQKGFATYLRGSLYRWRFKKCGDRLFIGRHCRVFFPRFISLGSDVYLAPYCHINGFSQNGIVLGNRVRIWDHTWIIATSELHQPGVGLEIGDETYIGPHGYLGAGGGISIGRGVLVGAYVQWLAENHIFSDPSLPIRKQGVSRKGIQVGDEVWVGNSAIILDGVTLGSGSIIGAGSVVTHDVPPGAIVAGNPARILRQRE